GVLADVVRECGGDDLVMAAKLAQQRATAIGYRPQDEIVDTGAGGQRPVGGHAAEPEPDHHHALRPASLPQPSSTVAHRRGPGIETAGVVWASGAVPGGGQRQPGGWIPRARQL